jgi:hypothetical protein
MVNDEQGPSDEPGKGRKKRIKSIEEIEKEAHELLGRVGGGTVETLRNRVAFILNRNECESFFEASSRKGIDSLDHRTSNLGSEKLPNPF